MNQSTSSDYTCLLRSLMQQAGVSSFKALSRAAGVSEWQVRQLRQGHAARMRVDELYRLSQVLQIPLIELIGSFSSLQWQDAKPSEATSTETIEQLRQEYQRLQEQLNVQREQLWQEFKRASLNTLESWMIQFPTAAYAAQQNPQAPAVRLLPLVRPVEQLLKEWGVEAIAPVGTEVPYDPQFHHLMDGTVQAGDRVRVRYTGYRQGEKLLHRAKVSPVAGA